MSLKRRPFKEAVAIVRKKAERDTKRRIEKAQKEKEYQESDISYANRLTDTAPAPLDNSETFLVTFVGGLLIKLFKNFPLWLYKKCRK